MGDWWNKIMSGADNQTPAIGRYLGLALFVIAILLTPAVMLAINIWRIGGLAAEKEWLTTFAVYIASVSGSVSLLIWGTHGTEPRKKDDPDG